MRATPPRPRSRQKNTAEPAAPRTQAQRRSDSERRLIEAAREVLARRGWVGMTLSEVGEAAGLSRGLASHRFESKAGLLRALTTHISSSYEDALREAAPAQPGLAAVLGFVEVYFDRTDPQWTNTRSMLLLMAEGLIENSETADVLAVYTRRLFDYLEHNIRIGIERGEIDAATVPALGAEMVIGTLRGMMLQRLVARDFGDLSAMRTQVMRMIERTFSA